MKLLYEMVTKLYLSLRAKRSNLALKPFFHKIASGLRPRNDFCNHLYLNLQLLKNIAQKKFRAIIPILIIAIFILFLAAYPLQKKMREIYVGQESVIIADRNNIPIYIQPNNKGYYSRYLESVPQKFKNLLIKKEDKFFFYHLGINPFSISRDVFQYIFSGKSEGQSTITQQLAKLLLNNEGQRNLKNKIIESIYAVSLELYTSKEQILLMYANSAYFGNQAQGLKEASYFYFNKGPEILSDLEISKLLASLNSPSKHYPGTYDNEKIAALLLKRFGEEKSESEKSTDFKPEKNDEMRRKNEEFFELNDLNIQCPAPCQLTIDKNLTEKLRRVLKKNIEILSSSNAENGAIVAIKLPENELIAIVGSPDPSQQTKGYQINMATKPRPAGSMFKPFIYTKAFEKGARPYSLIEDKEYKYEIGTGFPLYPKNYDGKYHGTVTLHYALSNSLNVPAVKVLEYAELENFYDFLKNNLKFESIQPLENYGLGIALGGLEMSPLALSEYFTIFPNKGILKPLIVYKNPLDKPLSIGGINDFNSKQKIISEEIIELINKILSDRKTAIDQFGLKSNLNLEQDNYALKTGTSYDYHDSWVIGYTPDFLVAVWIGNSSNKPMRQISGQSGAGKIWQETMEIMLNSSYNKKTAFSFAQIKEFTNSGSIEYGLDKDDYEKNRLILQKPSIIKNPHDDDVFLFEKGMTIPLETENNAKWFINKTFLKEGKSISWQPEKADEYLITAATEQEISETIKITIKKEE